MRSHAVVALIAFLAGALVVWLILFTTRSERREIGPVQPGASTSSVSPAPSQPIAQLPATKSVVAEKATIAAVAPKRTPTERRTLCLLGGFVRSSSESSRPVPGAYVGLYQPALEDDGPTSAFGQWGGTPERFPKWRELLAWTYTDDDGQFSFDELKAGTYIVRAELGPLVSSSTAPQTLEVGEVRAGLDIALPISGGLEGRILAPPDISFDTWRVALQRIDTVDVVLPATVDGRADDCLDKGLDDDGTFRLGPAQVGLHRVWLVWPGPSAQRWKDIRLPIGEVRIEAGDYVKREFDLRQGFPGSLNVTLHIPAYERPDSPPMFARVPFTITAAPGFKNAKVESVGTRCRIGETCVLVPLEPGMWSLSVQSPIANWIFDVPSLELVEAGRAQDVSLEIQLFDGTLTCIDPTSGGPLADTEVIVWKQGNGDGAKTDAQGRVHLLFPKGTYTIGTTAEDNGKFDDGLPETFDWQEDGPHPSTVKLLRPPSAPR